jgi:hypothetical protein
MAKGGITMNRRMIDGSIWANEKFSELPPMACLLQMGLINLADDQGRMKAHPAYLRSQIFPYRNVTNKQVSQWLELIVANGTAIVYRVDDKEYLQLVNWWEYQSHSFAAPSEYPRPGGWQDRVRFTGKSRTIYTCNWIVSSGERLEDTCDQDGNPLPRLAKPHSTPGDVAPSQPHAQASSEPVTPLIEDKENEEDTENAKAAEPPAFLRENDGDKDGRFTMQLVSDQNLFGLFRSDAKKRAAALEETYRMEDIRSAVGVMVERHLAMVDKGERGIQDAISFLAKILHDEFKTAEDKRIVRVEVLMAPSEYHPNGHTVYDKMSLASARQSGFKIVEYLQ